MKLVGIAFLATFASTFSLTGTESDDLIAKLRTNYEQSLSLAADPLVALDKRYVEELEKLKLTYQSSGDLESVLLVDSERKNYREEEERDYRLVPGLHRLRSIYDENRLRLNKTVIEKQIVTIRRSIEKFGDLTLKFTQDGDFASALKCREITEEIEETLAGKTAAIRTIGRFGEAEKRYNKKVSATSCPGSSFDTGIDLVKGQKFKILPNPDDTWSGGGSKAGVFCDYQGYPDLDTDWMRMFSQVGSETGEPVDPEETRTASGDGTLQLFAEDRSAGGNVGEIRVEILVYPVDAR